MALGDDDKVEIKKTIEDEVLETRPIEFRSTRSTAEDGGRLGSAGELSHERERHTRSTSCSSSVPTEPSPGRATVTQSDWGIKPYSGLFGTLKVRDEVEVLGEAALS